MEKPIGSVQWLMRTNKILLFFANGCKIHVDIMILVCCLSRKGGDGVKGVEGELVILAATSFTLLENMKI